ncbi:MAG: VWA domain-containing protein [Planctomycetes bacterium]|nr:VWA domain-containing protein [Planctomycetota bacterium]
MTGLLTIAVGALVCGGLGAVFGKGGSPAARMAGWTVALAFLVALLLRPSVVWSERRQPAQRVDLPSGAADLELLAAAAHAAPAAAALQVHWQAGTVPPAPAVFGAELRTPRPLPFEPATVLVRLLDQPAAGRPLVLEVHAPRLATPMPARVRVHAGGQEVAAFDVALGAPPKPLSLLPTQPGPHAWELRAADGDRELLWHGTFAVAEPTPVLVLEPSGLAAAALQAQGVPVRASLELPADLAPFAAVVLGTRLPAEAEARLVQSVQDGLGLFVVGAGLPPAAAPLAELLPMRILPAPDPAGPETTPGPGSPGTAPPTEATPPPAEPREPSEVPPDTPVGEQPIEVDKHTIALVLVVDRSGSMGSVLADGRTKMSYAKSSALRTAQTLGEGDQVAIVTFGTKNEGRVELPLTDATATAVVRAGCERLAHANEMTFLLSGLQKAYELLQASPAAVKHVVVVSDGEFDRNEGIALGALANRMREQAKATLSVISIVDPFTSPTFKTMAERLARDGGGQFVTVSEPGSVPAFVAAEVTRSLERAGRTPKPDGGVPAPQPPKEPTERRDPPPKPKPDHTPDRSPPPRRITVRAVAESTLLAPLPAADWPTLARAQPGTARQDAQVLLVAGDEGWPLLASTNRGLGRVVAFAADLFGPDGAEFRGEAAFPARLAAWLQSLRPAVPTATPSPGVFATSTPAPTPSEHAVWLAMAGAAAANPAGVDSVPAGVDPRRSSPTAVAAGLLAAALVGLVALERRLAARARRSGVA